jgi:hypothetical protein
MNKPRFRKDVYRWDWASESWYLRSWVRWIEPKEREARLLSFVGIW